MRRKLIVAALALLVTHAAAVGATSPAGAEPSPRLELTRNSAGTNGLRFDIARPHRMDRAPTSSVVADLDGDPWPDLATTLSDADSIVLLMDEALDDQERRVGIHVTGRPFDLAAGDLDGDGHVDLVCSLLDTGEFDVLRGLGAGAFAPALAFAAGAGPRGIALADLDADGDLDLAVACHDEDLVRVFLNQGDGTFAAPTAWAIGSGPQMVIADDATGDGRPDLLTADTGSSTISCLTNLGGGAFAASVATSLTAVPHNLSLADFDGDGHTDLALSTDVGGMLFAGDGTGRFGSVPAYIASHLRHRDEAGMAVADIDADGRPDLVLAEAGATSGWPLYIDFAVVRIHRNLGGWRFDRASAFRCSAAPGRCESPTWTWTGDWTWS